MAIKACTMPKWGIEMREGTLAEWLVPEGASFVRGDLLALIETDKITNEMEAEFPATLRRIVVPGGQTRPVGALLAIFTDAQDSDADVDAFLAAFYAVDTSTAAGGGKSAPAPASVMPAPARDTPAIGDNIAISPQARRLAAEQSVDVSLLAGSGRGGRITFQDVDQAARPVAAPVLGGPLTLAEPAVERVFASPLARRIAAQHGIALAALTGTGPRGRINKADVLAEHARATVGNHAEILPMSTIRKVIARRLTEAKATIPHFYLRADAAADALIDLRHTANLVTRRKASLNDYLLRAVALALMKVPDVNIQVHGSDIHRFRSADIAVAVATERGLVTPILRGAERLPVHDIAEAVRALAAKAHAGRLGVADLEGGTFTVSNLGMFGIDQFDAIINPPQGAILAVGATRRVFAEGLDGEHAFATRIALSLSCDHRAIDGATGATFLAALRQIIEAPEQLFSV